MMNIFNEPNPLSVLFPTAYKVCDSIKKINPNAKIHLG